ncbi:hypothetical protein [Tepidiforma sp.]|uniref:hypothetical protein n=1 Tax=Tepidiforma sp. TaxID=2682230 RepID=UPI002ADD3795|nr:hypothetical protein [Tepidiforma sp.]
MAGTVTPRLPFDLQPDEAVLAHVRRHWLYFSLRMAGIVAAGVGGTALLAWLSWGLLDLEGTASRVAMVVVAGWATAWAVRGYFTWYRYQNDTWTVTNQRLVDSLKRHWFHHQMASADLVDVEDLRIVRSGVLSTLFDFGAVQCQTAGNVPNFVLAGVPKPSRLLAVVDAARDAARRSLGRPPA